MSETAEEVAAEVRRIVDDCLAMLLAKVEDGSATKGDLAVLAVFRAEGRQPAALATRGSGRPVTVG